MRANDLGFWATTRGVVSRRLARSQLTVAVKRIIPNVTRAADSGPRDRCDHSIKVKKPFHRRLLKLVHPDCRLSERRFDFHSMRVSGEKTALVQIVTSAP
jgi:hypothetical protein